MNLGIEIKKISVAIADFGMTFIFNFSVFWVMTQILGIRELGDLFFVLAFIMLITPILTLSLPNFILLEGNYETKQKINAAWYYSKLILVLSSIITIIVLSVNSYNLSIIIYAVHILIVATEAIPRTVWKNRHPQNYVFWNFWITVSKLVLVFILYFWLSEIFLIGVAFLNIVSSLFFWNNLNIERQANFVTRLVLKDAWRFSKPILISVLIVVMYTRLDQIMIGLMLNKAHLAHYSIGVKVSDGIIGLWTAVLAFYFHALLNDQKRYARIILLAWLYGVSCAIFLFFVSDFLVLTVFGNEFQESGNVIRVLSIGTTFIALNCVGAVWLQSNGIEYLEPYRASCGLLVNAVGNLFMIPSYGIMGAAVATVLSQFVVCFIAPLISKKSYKLLKVQMFLRTEQWR